MPRRYCGYAALAAALLALPTATIAQNRVAGIRYDCDTAPNNYSELVLPAGPAPFLVSGKLKLMKAIAGKDYLPMTRFTIVDVAAKPDPSDKSWAGFGFVVMPAGIKDVPAGNLLTSILKTKGTAPQQEFIAPPSNAEIAFSVSYDGTQVTLNVDGHSKTLAYSAAQPAARIVCSTGEFLYTDLVITPKK